jgi:hypothetical protein
LAGTATVKYKSSNPTQLNVGPGKTGKNYKTPKIIQIKPRAKKQYIHTFIFSNFENTKSALYLTKQVNLI